ncbi:MAG TPA: shikimate kinase [Vicinamibacteria bacterium]|nr:shikimate kinase [Vicinamibacteria bacterium]
MDADRLLAGLGARVRALRAGRGATLRELAARSGLSERFLVQVEAGEANISVRRLADLARALGTSPAELLDGPGGERDRPLVALLGLRGAGKTTIGGRLARRLRVPFVELDRRVEEAAGLALDEVFALHGEDYYRRLERETLERVIEDGHSLVLATGGGIVTRPETFALLRQVALTVWLRADPEDHWNRVVQQGDRRPMADHPAAMAELRRLLAAREPLYAAAAHTVETSGREPDEVVRAIEALVSRRLPPEGGRASAAPPAGAATRPRGPASGSRRGDGPRGAGRTRSRP